MSPSLPVVVGVDVGGTNTDAVVVTKVKGQGHKVLAEYKHLTTADVTTGVRNAIVHVLNQAREEHENVTVTQINIGTTHFVNAVVQNKHLAPVSVIRLCGPASTGVPPFADFPASLKASVMGSVHFVDGGFRVDGRPIKNVDQSEVKAVVEELKKKGMKHIVVCGIFAPTRNQQEIEVEKLIKEMYPEASVTLSHTIGHIGLLQRENAAILNETLKDLCQRTVSGFRHALREIGASCPMYLTQNDGTIISEQQALATPVFTFASGPTNSMRGAAFLCQLTDALVVDIGGTTTDVGVLKNRFPRQASTDVRVAGVRTNFRMPDMHSVGLGGGSYVSKSPEGRTVVGPLSAGFNLHKEALVFGTVAENKDPESGRRMTTTDVAVAAGLMDLGDKALVAHLAPDDVTEAVQVIQEIIEDTIDRVRISDETLPVILVGGGSKLLDWSKVKMKGVSEVLLPDHYGVANAIGAALSQVSGNVDNVVALETLLDRDVLSQREEQARRALPAGASQNDTDKALMEARKPLLEAARELALSQMSEKARQLAVQSGADASTVQIVEQEGVALSYLPGSATRIKMKAVGDLLELADGDGDCQLLPWTPPAGVSMADTDVTTESTKQTRSVTGRAFVTSDNASSDDDVTWAGLTPTRPQVNPDNGEWILNAWDVECIAVGAGFLGAGGGGSPNIGRIRARMALDNGQAIRIISPERLTGSDPGDSDVVVGVGYMGSPVVIYEQIVEGGEVVNAIRCVRDLHSIGGYSDGDLSHKDGVDIKEKDGVVYIDDYRPVCSQPQQHCELDDDVRTCGRRRVKGILCCEVGGSNALEPLLVSAKLGIPTVDADGMGRAFPMLQMLLPIIAGEKLYPMALADDLGRRAAILRTETVRQVEDHFRIVTMDMGSSAGLAMNGLPVNRIEHCIIYRSMSRAWTIGDVILRARRQNKDTLKALKAVEDVHVLITGKIRDVSRQVSGGFCHGFVRVEGTRSSADETCRASTKVAEQAAALSASSERRNMLRVLVMFQNENLVVRIVDEHDKPLETLAAVPDIITIMDSETAEPISTEEVRYGQRVSVVVLPAPPPMTTPRALQEVGPAAFGLTDVQYVPLGLYREPEALAPK